MFQNDGRVFVRRRQHERFHQDSLAPTVKFGGGGIMMRGAMLYRGTGILKKLSGISDAKGYIKIIEDAAPLLSISLAMVTCLGIKMMVSFVIEPRL